jgi:hypothetical protein
MIYCVKEIQPFIEPTDREIKTYNIADTTLTAEDELIREQITD